MFVTSIVVAMIVIFVVVACVVGLVLLGIDGEPPARLIKLIESSRGR
jgi:hypothetical protein